MSNQGIQAAIDLLRKWEEEHIAEGQQHALETKFQTARADFEAAHSMKMSANRLAEYKKKQLACQHLRREPALWNLLCPDCGAVL